MDVQGIGGKESITTSAKESSQELSVKLHKPCNLCIDNVAFGKLQVACIHVAKSFPPLQPDSITRANHLR